MRIEVVDGARGVFDAMRPTCLPEPVFIVPSRAVHRGIFFFFCRSTTGVAQELVGGGKLLDGARHRGAIARYNAIGEILCMPYNGSSNSKFVLTV